MKFSLGADPELFMADLNGQLRAACGKIGGTKAHPQPMGIGDGFMIQEDNVAVEFNIPPASSANEFVSSLDKALTSISESIRQMYDYSLVNISAAQFPEEELMHPAALEFGCDPDYNAWTKRKNPRPSSPDKTLRSCGGHVHVGLPESLKNSRLEVIKAMDLFLGVPSVLMDQGHLRKRLYGKRGAFRIKPYGVEYRTLSNFWVFNPKLINWVWRNTERALLAVEAQSIDLDSEADKIRIAIDTNNPQVATELINQYNLEVVHA